MSLSANIPTIELTWYGNCGLHVNFWNFLVDITLSKSSYIGVSSTLINTFPKQKPRVFSFRDYKNFQKDIFRICKLKFVYEPFWQRFWKLNMMVWFYIWVNCIIFKMIAYMAYENFEKYIFRAGVVNDLHNMQYQLIITKVFWTE